MARKILLSSSVSWISIARLAAGFSATGLEVHALAPKRAPVRVSRYLKGAFTYEPLAPQRSLRNAIAALQPELIVACDDRAVAQLLHLFEEECLRGRESGPIASLIARSLGAPRRYKQIISRNSAMELASKMGIRVPETHPVANESDLDALLLRIGYPAVLKADGTWGGEGVAIVKTRDQAFAAFHRLASAPSRLRSFARAVRRRDLHFLADAVSPEPCQVSIQRFVEGIPAASAFASWNGEITAHIGYDVLKADEGVGPPNVIRRVDCPEIESAARLVARCFNLSGLHGLDFIRDRDGRVHLLEINPRATQGGTLAFGPGRDLPAGLAASLLGHPVGMREPIESDTVALFPREWLREPQSPYLKSAHHDVPWDDPAVLRASIGPSAAPRKVPRMTRVGSRLIAKLADAAEV